MILARIALMTFLLIVVTGLAAAQPLPEPKPGAPASELLDYAYCSAWEKAKEQFGVKLLNLIGDPTKQRTALEALDIGHCPRAISSNSAQPTPPSP